MGVRLRREGEWVPVEGDVEQAPRKRKSVQSAVWVRRPPVDGGVGNIGGYPSNVEGRGRPQHLAGPRGLTYAHVQVIHGDGPLLSNLRDGHSVPLSVVEGPCCVGSDGHRPRAQVVYQPGQPITKLHPQEVSLCAVDLVEQRGVRTVSTELDRGLVDEAVEEYLTTGSGEIGHTRAVKGSPHLPGPGLEAGDSTGQGVGSDVAVGLERWVPSEGHRGGGGVEDEGRSLPHWS